MKNLLIIVLLALTLFVGVIPQTVSAEASPPQDYMSNFPAVALGIAAGQANWQAAFPTSMPTGAGTYHVIIDVSTNVAPAAGVALALGTAGFAFSSPGCTVGVFVQDAVSLTSVSGYVPITVAAGTKYCYGTGRFTLTLLPPINVIISSYRLMWEFEVETSQNANFDFLCDAPGITLTAYNEGTTVCNDVVLTATLAGTLTVAGTLNVVNSGGQNIAITSWPTLLTTLSGGLTITDDANGWAITSTNALSGTINVVNSGGQTIAISSWPELLATLSGELDIHQDEACGATIPCQLSGDLGFSGNFSVNNTFSGNTTVGQSEEFLQAQWVFIFFLFLILLAEWKKDLIYYLLAALVGLYAMTTLPTILGINRLLLLGVIFYLIMRIYKVWQLSRNTLAAPEEGDLHQ